MNNPLRMLVYIIVGAMMMLGSVSWFVVSDYTAKGPAQSPVILLFPPNTHATEIADMLATNGVIEHSMLFKAHIYLNGQASRFKAGEYLFSAGISQQDVVSMLVSGKTVVHHITIPEGLMTSEIIELLKKEPALDGEITLDMKDGDLLPDTYHFSRGDKRNDLLVRMHHAIQKVIAAAWAGRDTALPLTDEKQALTLASIVEKETGVPSERPRVAAVYINRLRSGMLLQADPTTAYAVTQGKYKLPRPLTYDDLKLESPYNTYVSKGLPPAPIANPGKASIMATLHPVQSEELYFVATGTGGHYFARTLKEHEENVKRYRASRQK